MAKNIKRRNLIGGSRVVIKQHVVDRYVERCGVSEEEARSTLVKKFKNSKLTKLKPDGSEIRKEITGSMNKRLTFISSFNRRNNTFYVFTCFLQGPRNNWWKNEGLIEEDTDNWSDNQSLEITREMAEQFGEEKYYGTR
jgi:hypothetical protein